MKHAASIGSLQVSPECVPLSLLRGQTQPATDFTDAGNGMWLCSICKVDSAMTAKQAMNHEVAPQHAMKAGASDLQVTTSMGRKPTHSMLADLGISGHEDGHWTEWSLNLIHHWRKGLEAAERGEETEPMHEFLDKQEEEWADRAKQDPWAAPTNDAWELHAPGEDWTPAPGAWGKPLAMGLSGVRHANHCARGASSATSMRQEDTRSERKNARDDTAPFVEEYIRGHDVDARRGDKMRVFCEMPTDQKIKKIQEMINDLREHRY
ncbi:hypothetical protein BC834DRAFT_859293 [Gloeopeniophorella convolvens]|nr:hypothetical protein BC834DRAFT_859293 [Gloeopeniophorella convolvens]